MTEKELAKWQYLTQKYPERAGLAYELYVRHKTKDANITTYFMWAGKLERQTEQRYRNGLRKFCDKKKITMELEKW